MASITQMTPHQYADSTRLAARAKLHQFSHAEVPWFTWVARHLSVAPGASILDIGCGPAWFWPPAIAELPRDLALTLFDQSPGMVGEAMERCRPLPFASVEGKTGDAVALPFADASFDAVIAMHMLYHVADRPGRCPSFIASSSPVAPCW
jgi:ubiquinone/menaquinone biosynthesis C-methylase UbiE